MNHKPIGRKLPVRVTYVGIATVAYLVTPWVIKFGGMLEHTDTVYSSLMALLGLITAALGGDTIRPSGMIKEAQSSAN